MGTRREPRSVSRAKFWRKEITSAPDGDAALVTAWRWLRSELRKAADQRPQEADMIRRQVASQLADVAASVPAYRPRSRKGSGDG